MSGSTQSRQASGDHSSIEALLALASKLYQKAKRTELELLAERIEIGGILIRLKNEVPHGDFLPNLKKWIASKQLNFSYATANRAMAYAELNAAGKLSSVQNLAEAEKVKKAEAARKKAEERNAAGSDEPPDELVPEDDTPAAKLKKPEIGLKAKQLAKPALEECRGYDTKTRVLLLEELIEVFNEELEECE